MPSPRSTRPVACLDFISFAGFVIACFAAPLAYGGTRPLAFSLLVGLCGFSTCFWFGSLALRRGRAELPAPVLIGAGLVLAVAAWHLWAGPAETMPPFTARHWARIVDRWPAAVTVNDPIRLISWAIVAVLSLLALVDLLRRRPGLRLLLATAIVGAGVLTALFGLLQNFTHAPGIYWERDVKQPGNFFGPFYHHTSAGAYLNVVLPIAVGLAWRSARRGHRFALILAGIAALLILIAHAGHVSRLPQLLGLIGVAAMLLVLVPWRRLKDSPHRWTIVGTTALLAVLLGTAVAATGKVDTIKARWATVDWRGFWPTGSPLPPPPFETWPSLVRDDLFIAWDHRGYVMGDRGALWSTALQAAPRHPWIGYGPGGWMTASAITSTDPFSRTFFQHLQFTHQDALQTLVEWGLIGTAGWALLILWPAARQLKNLWAHPDRRSALTLGVLVALGAVLAQGLIDFPAQIPALQFALITLAALLWSGPRVSRRNSV